MVNSDHVKVCVPVLFENESSCCGCGACAAKCPQNAIAMVENAGGFAYPSIDSDLCIGCGLCVKSCGLQRQIGKETQGPFFAAVGKGDVVKSASGGVFASIAKEIILNGGVAYGAAYFPKGRGLAVEHQRASSLEELEPLLNSKYVQSDAGRCFIGLQKDLKEGLSVLFCGTPCQVAGLRGFLGRGWENLYTVDLVCHGVPSEKMFSECVESYADRYGSRVVDFRFRCKRHGWGHSLLLLLLLEDGREIEIPANECSYYDMFLKLKTLRSSCYRCPYACGYRAGDFTIGDFWGIETNRPDVLRDKGKFNQSKGVSCLLVNTEHGKGFLDSTECLYLSQVEFNDIAKGNDQLRHPSVLPKDRRLYMDAFSDGGWEAVERLYKRREYGVAFYLKKLIKAVLPNSAVRFIKGLVGR